MGGYRAHLWDLLGHPTLAPTEDKTMTKFTNDYSG
jgi:hypothetical protein